MHNFGKFAPFSDESGFHLRNKAGQNLKHLLTENPHPFYIAVDDMSRIIEMSDEIETIQIPDFEIIGIDEDYGFSRGKNGNVYGTIWNGEAIVAPSAPAPILTARQFWLAALELGITETGLLAAIEDEDKPLYIEDETERAAAVIDITKAMSFKRDYPLVDDMAAAYGLSPLEMDALWAWAAQIE